MAFPLPKKPSIAVLPFDNLSEDPEQSYFSDGLTEEIINALSKVPYLFVIAKDSTFNYKNKPVKIKQVSEELGVRYILKGNVRKDSERIRLTAQLIDAMKGHYLWSERYERDLKDIFALQDEITMKIITALQVKLTMGEQARIQGKGTTNLDAYLKFLESREHFSRFNKEANIRARELAKEAIALDPEYASAQGQVGFTYWAELIMGWSESRKTSFKQMAKCAQKALALNDSEPRLHSLQAQVYQIKKQFEKALIEAEKAISLSPNHAGSYVLLGHTLRFMGRPEEAVEVVKHAIRLNPFPNPMYYVNLASSYLFLGKYEEAIEVYKKALKIEPNNLPANIGLTVAYSFLGKEGEAKTAGAEILRINPKFSVDKFAKRLPYRIQSYNDLLVEGLRKAGLQ